MADPEIAIRPERPGEEPAVRAVNLAAFPTSSEADLVDALRDSAAWLPGGSLVGEADGQVVVGHLLLSRAHLITRDRPPDPILALGPMAVLPVWQRTGVGSALVRAAIAWATAAGERCLVVLGHPGFYPRFGFRPARAMGIEPPLPWPDAAWMALLLPAASETAAPKGTVRYAAPFGIEGPDPTGPTDRPVSEPR